MPMLMLSYMEFLYLCTSHITYHAFSFDLVDFIINSKLHLCYICVQSKITGIICLFQSINHLANFMINEYKFGFFITRLPNQKTIKTKASNSLTIENMLICMKSIQDN